MSLLDDVSLMITPNGVSKNVLFGVLPTPIFSYEKIDLTSGATSEPSEWGSITTNGIKKLTSSATTYYETGFTVSTGKTYKASFTLSDYSGSSTMGFSNQGGVPSSIRLSGNGSVSGYFTATANAQLQLYGLDTNTGTFSDVSVKEVTTSDMDFTRATSANRVNPSGLVDGVTENLPRLDYRVSESCPHILVEPQRTNICLRSQQINESPWSASNVTVNANSVVSPNGVQNAEKVQKDGVSANDRIEQTITVSNSTEYSISAFLKNNNNPTGGKTTLAFRVSGGTLFRKGYEWTGSALAATTTYASGTRTNEFIEDYGNGWYRVGFSFTSDGTSGEIEIDVDRSGGTSTTSIYLWGCQLEQGGFKTAYILTTSASATRNGEIFERTGIGDLIGTEGVFFIEMAALSDDLTNRVISLNDGTSSNRLMLYYNTISNTISTALTVGGSTSSIAYVVSDETSFNKVAVRYKTNDITLWVNGQSRGVPITSATIPVFTALKFDSGSGASEFFGKVRQLQVYKTALSPTQLAALTT
jgi:hypothetical protein